MKWIFGVICLTASWAAVSATFCSSEDDCKEGYCCVGLTMSQMTGRGLCLRLAREKRQCNEPEAKNDYYGGKFHRYCPCAEGMVCESSKPGITDKAKRLKYLRCKKGGGATTVGPDVSTDSEIVTDGEIVTDDEVVETNPPDIVTDDIVDETLPPEIVTEEPEETEAPEETEGPEEEVVETEAPEEEVVETEAPEEEVVEEETEAPEEEVVEEETEAPEEEVVEEETEAPEEEDVVEEAGQRGPGGERPRPEDPDCEDWTYGC